VVDVWEEPLHQHPQSKLVEISQRYPHWAFVLVSAGNGKAILYRDGVETKYDPTAKS
ncbi:hypothetical protein HF283_06915, partial [Acidithiobacillus ferrooxidans]|nr:hypothetical protein [Acidithiobacillus ferrooxidans]